jgi:hypothetical protein
MKQYLQENIAVLICMRYKVLGFRGLGIGNGQESKTYLTDMRIAINLKCIGYIGKLCG